MDPVLHYHRPDAPVPLLPRLWHLARPLVVGLPLVVLLGVGMGMLVYGLGKPADIPAPSAEFRDYAYMSAWNAARHDREERAEVMGIGAGILTAGLTTAVLYGIRFLRQNTRAFGAVPPSPPAGAAPQGQGAHELQHR